MAPSRYNRVWSCPSTYLSSPTPHVIKIPLLAGFCKRLLQLIPVDFHFRRPPFSGLRAQPRLRPAATQTALACLLVLLGLLLLAVEGRTQDLTTGRAKRSHLLPHIADGDGWQSTLLVTNVARSPSACRLQLHGLSADRFQYAGNVQTAGSAATFNLPEAGSHLTWRTSNQSALASGYATLECTEPVAAQVVFASIGGSGRPLGMATVFSSQAGWEFQFPVLTPEATLGFAIANDTAVDAACRIVLEDLQGTYLGEAPLPVPSKTNRAGRLLDRIISIPPTFGGGTATVSCDQPVAVIGLHFELQPDRTITTFSTLPPAVLVPLSQATDETAKRSHLLPHIADGDGWQSTLLVTNVARSPSACRLQLHGLSADRFQYAGNVQTAGSAATFNLPEAGSHLTWRTSNQSALASGYATLECTEPVAAQVVFASIGGSGRPLGMATVFSSQAGWEFQFPVLTPEATLGFAIANDTAVDAACRIVLEDLQGTYLGEAPLPVPSKTNRAGRLLDRIISIPPTFGGGTATVSCDQPVAVIGLHFELQPDRTITTFSTLPPAVLVPLSQATSDREVLERLYHATGGPEWNNRTNWLSDSPLSEWHGVATDGSGRVTSLDLPRNGLFGNIPPELGWLTHLQRLDLNGNDLSGAIPVALAGLFDLHMLGLSHNNLSGAIPPELGGLTQLDQLYLSSNQLSGAIPPELGRMTNLRVLMLYSNRDLTGALPKNLQQLSRLTFLNIYNTDVCVPTDAAFEVWLGTIGDFSSSGLVCDGTRRIFFSAESYEVREGDSVTVSVRLIDRTGNIDSSDWSAEIALTAKPGGGATAADYSGVPESINITAFATEAAFVFTAVADDPFDHGETVVLGFQQPLPSGIIAGDLKTATVTIIDPGTEGVTDREVLEAIYHSTGGPEWSNSTNWLSAAPISEWFGVETDGSGRVTSLHLRGNQLSGLIPPALGRLSDLERLYLSANQLSGPLPPELGQLSQLQELDLTANQLSGAIPTELGSLANLQRLYLSANQLSGAIPTELGSLANLQELDLTANQLSGAIPTELGSLANLQRLYLSANQLSGAIPTELGSLANLQRLYLGFNPDLTGTIPLSLQQLSLSILELMATTVCVPEDSEFQQWLKTVDSFLPSRVPCGRSPDAMSSIEVAVFYTPAAREQAGGTAAMEAKIDLLVEETNQAYRDSEANQQILLAARQEVEYTESGSGDEDLERLRAPSDGHMDEVHAIRDRVGADLVHLLTDVTPASGAAYRPGVFGFTCAGCPALVFAHELGHNMGLSHDRYVDSGLLPYSYGYVNQQAFTEGAPESARWQTIMAYPDQCSDAGFDCYWIPRFSNSNQTYMGDPLGVPGEDRTADVAGPADAVRALNLTRHSVAAFRPRASGNQLTMSSTLSQARPLVRTGQAAVPTPGGSLFRSIAPNQRETTSQRAGGVLDRATLRRREVSVDIQTLARVADGERTALRLNLFDDLVLMGIIERRTSTYSGGYALSGRLAGVPEGTVTLVVNGSVVAGTVRLPGATFRIRPTGGGHAIDQIDPSQLTWRCGTEPGPR